MSLDEAIEADMELTRMPKTAPEPLFRRDLPGGSKIKVHVKEVYQKK
jgi:hypothetical protein